MASPLKVSTNSNLDMNSPSSRLNTLTNMNTIDQDEQFILDVIRTSKQESILSLTDSLRLQESKSYLLIRLLERYKDELDKNPSSNK